MSKMSSWVGGQQCGVAVPGSVPTEDIEETRGYFCFSFFFLIVCLSSLHIPAGKELAASLNGELGRFASSARQSRPTKVDATLVCACLYCGQESIWLPLPAVIHRLVRGVDPDYGAARPSAAAAEPETAGVEKIASDADTAADADAPAIYQTELRIRVGRKNGGVCQQLGVPAPKYLFTGLPAAYVQPNNPSTLPWKTHVLCCRFRVRVRRMVRQNDMYSRQTSQVQAKVLPWPLN